LPGLVREIRARGHEVASHGNNHQLCNTLSLEKLQLELSASKQFLEDIIGDSVYGYRAPSFSISSEILLQIMNAGYFYDSSWNSFSMHERYGRLKLQCTGNGCIPLRLSDGFYELPISNFKLKKPFKFRNSSTDHQRDFILPWGGGGYFRLLPLMLFRRGVGSILNNEGVYLFYMHPWEIDSRQPRVKRIKLGYRFRHYTNLAHTKTKLIDLIHSFGFCRFLSCRDFLIEKANNAA
jgi:polysaccharide deacetylase family protein (PEP-CTERM system associated)